MLSNLLLVEVYSLRHVLSRPLENRSERPFRSGRRLLLATRLVHRGLGDDRLGVETCDRTDERCIPFVEHLVDDDQELDEGLFFCELRGGDGSSGEHNRTLLWA